jgi:ATP-dependent exoDNAse (exonuclease V) beta subunit
MACSVYRKTFLKEGPNIDYLRWLYTAVTRAESKLYLIGF